MKLTLIPIVEERDLMEVYLVDDFCKTVFDVYQGLYLKAGFHPPWIGYFVLDDNEVVGMGGFKGKPIDNIVEVAYGILPAKEGKGYASQLCLELIEIAKSMDKFIDITARTLREDGPSTSVLKKCGFQYKGDVEDKDDGPVWEWLHTR